MLIIMTLPSVLVSVTILCDGLLLRVLMVEGVVGRCDGKLPVPGHPTTSDNSRARAHCACSRCEWGCLNFCFSLIYSSSLWETVRNRLNYGLKGLSDPTNLMVELFR